MGEGGVGEGAGVVGSVRTMISYMYMMSRTQTNSHILFTILATAVLLLCTTYLYAVLVRTVSYMSATDTLVAQAVPYEREQNSEFTILVLGDSLAYGVGNSSPEQSFAGRLGAHFPKASITNKAVVGDIVRDLARSIESAIDRHYDMIVILIGGNDIVHHGVDLEESKQHLQVVYRAAANSADEVYFVSTADFRNVSLIPAPLKNFFSARSRAVHEQHLLLASEYSNVVYVDTYTQEREQYRQFEAADRIHLNDQGAKALFEAFCALGCKGHEV